MPMTEQDARALAYLAGRLREETFGANRWDAPGVWAELHPLVGQNLAVSIERVIRHAQDPTAKTPGAIRRPFVPDGPEDARPPLKPAPVGSRCTVCGLIEADCKRHWSLTGNEKRDELGGRHEFTRPVPRDVDLAPVVAEVKAHVAHRRTEEESK